MNEPSGSELAVSGNDETKMSIRECLQRIATAATLAEVNVAAGILLQDLEAVWATN